MKPTHWLSDADYAKAKFHLRAALTGIFDSFKMYGLQENVPGAIEEAVRVAEDFSLIVRGVDRPISLERIRRTKSK